MKTNKISMPRQRDIAKLYNEGLGVQLIAERFGISTASVSYYAKKHGCVMRKAVGK